MNEAMKRLPNETEDECLLRIAKAKREGLIDLYWENIADWLNKTWRADETEYRTESSYRKKAKNLLDASDCGFLEQKRAAEQAKMQLQSEKTEYQRWLREEARDKLIADKIVNAIRELQPLKIPATLPQYDEVPKSAVLCFGDEHYGTEFKIYGLFGEILNEYSPEIFEERMYNLLNQVIQIIHKENIKELYVFAFGDCCDGIIRASQLMRLRYGVIESAVKYADFISHWLYLLSNEVRIKYQMTYGNHTELRQIGQPKGTFKDDNTGMFVREMIKTRLENNPNFEMIVNPTGLIFDTIQGYNILGIHGEVPKMDKAVKDFSTTYDVPIHILIGGHMHHYNAQTIGFNQEVINIPSIIGVDDFSMSLNKTSKPGAAMFLIEENCGITTEYKIKLN